MLGGSPNGHRLQVSLGRHRNGQARPGDAGPRAAGRDRPLVAAFATMAMKPGRLATEDNAYDPKAVGAPRGASEDTCGRWLRSAFAPPSSGFRRWFTAPVTTPLLRGSSSLLEKRESRPTLGRPQPMARGCTGSMLPVSPVGTGEGTCGSHVSRGCRRGRAVPRPLPSSSGPSECAGCQQVAHGAAKQFSFMSPFISVDNPVSSKLTQERLGLAPDATRLTFRSRSGGLLQT